MRRVIPLAAGVMLLATFLFATSANAAGNRLTVRGSQVYANGADLPWIDYGNDIGGNAWGEYGFHAQTSKLDADFSTLQSQRVTTLRVWLFADARAGITFDSSGMPTALDPNDMTDLDALTSAASAHGVYLNLVLFDSSFMEAADNMGSGVVGGGHYDLVDNGSGGQALERVVVKPVLEHLAGNPAVFSIETMNEPENCTSCSIAGFNAWTTMVASDVHSIDPGVSVTVGGASAKFLKQYQGDGLDFYQLHDYGDTYAPSVLSTPAGSFGLDKPIVVGEYAADSSTAAFTSQMDGYYAEGYAGAWVWSFGDVDSVGTYAGPTMASWNAAHPDTEVGGAGTTASPTATPTRTPTATPVSSPTSMPTPAPAPRHHRR